LNKAVKFRILAGIEISQVSFIFQFVIGMRGREIQGGKKMKQNQYMLTVINAMFISWLFVLMMVSCKTVPAPRPDELEGKENLALATEKARAFAIEKGADKTHSELFSQTDKRFSVAKSMVEKNREGAIKEFGELALVYKVLANLAQALQLKDDIDEMGFSGINPEMYKKAEELYNDAVSRCEKDANGALKASEEALSLYNELCDKGFANLVEQAKNEAKLAKNNCDSINASRSMTSQYNGAVKLYNAGSVATKEKRYRDAYKSYISARDEFNKTFKMVEDKRKEAEDALNRARAKMKESSSLAKEADKASPLKEGTVGFGEVDSSSLENKDSDKQEVDKIAD